ncbi:Hint domain-containing protein [Roseateles sp. BYS96W]|uniref:Hint domain-containing protein n=1 Tax=Pelomonas nitida TaxID=3299027 RepID=A0ABW7G9Y2_9BURK
MPQEKILSEITQPADAVRSCFESGACFAAGTLVHTKEGLKPIEQIQVGDWVLSKPENGGEQACKRVVKTFAHPPERVVEVQYVLPNQDINSSQGFRVGRLVATPSHPFWTKEEGWTAPINMQGYGMTHFHFEDKDGADLDYCTIKNIYISDQPNVGWTPARNTVRTDDLGHLRDYFHKKWLALEVSAIDAVVDIDYADDRDALYFKMPVYSLDVEDFHTYYVGEHGIWVRNRNCGGLEIWDSQRKVGVG